MAKVRAKNIAVKIESCVGCGFVHVSAEPVTYLGREGFHVFASTAKAYFMDRDPTSKFKWCFLRRFKDLKEAEAFAVELCRALREPCFLNLGRVCLILLAIPVQIPTLEEASAYG